MSAINFLFGNRTTSGFSLSGAVEFQADLTIEEQHERTADLTQHPIETGAQVTDHVILNPERISVEGFVTDTPVVVSASRPGRVQSAFDLLETAWGARELVQVVTGRKTYRDMIITRLDLPRNRPASMQFRVELQHVKIVSTAQAELPEAGVESVNPDNVDDQDTADMASSEQDAGRQSTEEASEDSRVSTETQSTLSRIVDLF